MSHQGHFRSKAPLFLCSILFVLFSMLQISHLEAGGWGKTDEVFEHEGTTWNGVFFDMNGLNFTASIPNYSGTVMQNNEVNLKGSVKEGNIRYGIITSFNPGFTPPKSIKEFAKLVQEANPNYMINIIKIKKPGTKYVVDLIPANSQETIFWRFISTKDRLIEMGTSDTHENRRQYFFESIEIR